MKTILRIILTALLSAALALAVSASAAEPSRLEVKPVNGAPGWLLDAKPYVPIQAQAGRAQSADVHGPVLLRDGKALLRVGSRLELKQDLSAGESFTVQCTLTLDEALFADGGCYFEISGTTVSGAEKRYPIKLGWYGQICGVMNWLGANNSYVVNKPTGNKLGEPVRLKLTKSGATLRLEADGKPLGEWTDPVPIVAAQHLAVATYAARLGGRSHGRKAGWATDLPRDVRQSSHRGAAVLGRFRCG